MFWDGGVIHSVCVASLCCHLDRWFKRKVSKWPRYDLRININQQRVSSDHGKARQTGYLYLTSSSVTVSSLITSIFSSILGCSSVVAVIDSSLKLAGSWQDIWCDVCSLMLFVFNLIIEIVRFDKSYVNTIGKVILTLLDVLSEQHLCSCYFFVKTYCWCLSSPWMHIWGGVSNTSPVHQRM